MFTKKIEPCRVFEGESGIFTCVFTGYPVPHITWFRENFPIKDSQDFQVIHIIFIFFIELKIENFKFQNNLYFLRNIIGFCNFIIIIQFSNIFYLIYLNTKY